jgi:two-component system nitrogen regulation sensor histidine kinase NtrY
MGSSPLGKPNPTLRKPPRKRVRLLYERRISLFSLFVALPGMFFSGVFIWMQAWSVESRFALIFVELFTWWLLAMALHEQTTRPLQTLANVIAALREEDYSFRARGAATDDALGELSLEVNALADLLAEQRIRAIEATALVRRVVEEIEVPLFTFDPDQILRLVNSAGERLLQQPSVRLLGCTATEIGLDGCLSVESGTLAPLHFHDPNALAGASEFISAKGRAPHFDRSVRREPRSSGRRTRRLAASDSRARARTQ